MTASLASASKSPPSFRTGSGTWQWFPGIFYCAASHLPRAMVTWVSPGLRLPWENLGLECGILEHTMNFLQSELGKPERRLCLRKGCGEPIPFSLLLVGSGAPFKVLSLRTVQGSSSGGKDKAAILSFPRGIKHSLRHSSF